MVTYLIQNKPGQHSELILEVGIFIAQHYPTKLADITFVAFTEEFFLAALDLKQITWAELFLRSICKLFPDNIKSMRLLAMFYEA